MAKYRIVEKGNGTYRVDKLYFGFLWLAVKYFLYKPHAYEYVEATKIKSKPDMVLDIIDTEKLDG